jgi:hypothetical protein
LFSIVQQTPATLCEVRLLLHSFGVDAVERLARVVVEDADGLVEARGDELLAGGGVVEVDAG